MKIKLVSLQLQPFGFNKGTKSARPKTATSFPSPSLSPSYNVHLPLSNNQISQIQEQRPSTAGATPGRRNRETVPITASYEGPTSPIITTRSSTPTSRPNTAPAQSGAENGIFGAMGFPRREPQSLNRRTPVIPKYIETEKQVCRFYGHFFQSRNWDNNGPLGYPTIENSASRRLTILYYLNDQTVEMIEPKTQNSGKRPISYVNDPYHLL